jgi:hypothetical protein
MATKTNTTTAVVPTSISADTIKELLQQSGMLSQATSNFRRMRLDGGMLVTLDAQGEVEDMFPPKIVKGEPQPSLTVRIVEPPVYYNAFWLGPEVDEKGRPTGAVDPNRIGHPELAKSFSKKYDDPAKQAEDKGQSNEFYDELEQVTGKRGAFRADVQLQIVPDSGELTGEEPIFTLSLSASAALDWRGTRRNPTGGVVQDENFIVQLANFAVTQVIEAGGDDNAQKTAVLNAMTALKLGGVVADIYLLRASNDDGSNTWTIPAFKPVHVEMPEAPAPALSATTDAATESPDDIGF